MSIWRGMGLILAAGAALLSAQPKRILYLTHSAGFRHDCIPASAGVLRELAAASGKLDVTWSEDAGAVTAENLPLFDGVLFYTSGELPFSEAQKRALLDFVQRGGGFAGIHSATDTLYSWAEYGALIGGYFDGHPWVQEVRVDVEDPEHPAVKHLPAGFPIVEEIYQFRALSRERVRPLLTLDTSSVRLDAPGVQPGTADFPLAWTRLEGAGRVFYTAFGHFEETWRDPRFQKMMLEALLWVTRLTDGVGAPRPGETPEIAAVGNAASLEPQGVVAPDSIVSMYGRGLTAGSAAPGSYATKLAGATVQIGGQTARLLYASPGQINAVLPVGVEGPVAAVVVSTAGRQARVEVRVAPSAPGIFAVTQAGRLITLWATGLGRGTNPEVAVSGRPARVLGAGMSPQWFGLQQVHAELPEGVGSGIAVVELRMPGSEYTARFEARLD